MGGHIIQHRHGQLPPRGDSPRGIPAASPPGVQPSASVAPGSIHQQTGPPPEGLSDDGSWTSGSPGRAALRPGQILACNDTGS
ncbi:hypothetical protein DB31_3428 [Hyalangium minutum]|uniref:Uncharacterized protein n=1 Tax=Hyalangium minutum TaxID=394096 RepID=A0A085WUD5_9BACT|nr:hypothetical protein DB31_3428 [Hyalangium minutum]